MKRMTVPLAFFFQAVYCIGWLVTFSHVYGGGAHAPASAPVITSVSGCSQSQDNSSISMVCSIPFTLTITGVDLQTYDVANVSNTVPSCSQSSTQMLCEFPNVYQQFLAGAGQPVTLAVSVLDLSTLLRSSVLSIRVLNVPPVVLTAISGCSGSGAATFSCDLQTSVVTVKGSGFQLDNQPWYLLLSTFRGELYTDRNQVTSSSSAAYLIDSVNHRIVLPLNYTIPYVIPAGSLAVSGNMTICFSHGNTLSNCLALSYTYNGISGSLPIVAPTTALVTASEVSVTGVAGCTTNNADGTTTGCSTSASLTITGRNFSVYATSLLVRVGHERCIEILASSASDGSVYLTCSVPNEFTARMYNVWLPVVVIDLLTQTQTEPFAGVLFVPPSPGSLTLVSGCAGDGATASSVTTSQCNYARDIITIIGHGFEPSLYYTVLSCSSDSCDYPSDISLSFFTVNSTTIMVPVSFLVRPFVFQASGPIITSSLCLVYGLSNQLLSPCAVITTQTPSPTVSSVLGCVSNGPLQTVDCMPGVSMLTLLGSDFSQWTGVYVAGQICPLTRLGLSALFCTLPVITGFQPGVAYDVVITGELDDVTLFEAVVFTGHPTINSLTSQFCPADYVGSTTSRMRALYCAPGSILTIVGAYFSDLDSLSVVISSNSLVSGAGVALACPWLQFASATVLTCVLPDPSNSSAWENLAPLVYSSGAYVQVVENGTFSSNRILSLLFYNPAVDPHIESVQGCSTEAANTFGVVGCQPSDILTIFGENFVNSSSTEVQLFSEDQLFPCSRVKVQSVSRITCVLPYVPQNDVSTVLPVRVYSMNGRQSNWLVAVNYHSVSTSSLYRSRFIITLSVLLSSNVLLLILLLLSQTQRRWRKACKHNVLLCMFFGCRRELESQRDDLHMGEVNSSQMELWPRL